MFRIAAFFILLIVAITIFGSWLWIIPFLILAAIIEANRGTVTVNFRVDE